MINLTSTEVVNQAIMLMGDNQPLVTGTVQSGFDTSPAGIAAAILYTGVVQTVGRQFGWDFSRAIEPLQPTGEVAPWPWQNEYYYPADAIQVWQLTPNNIVDPNNPLPVQFVIGNDVEAGIAKKVIWTNLSNALAVYNNSPPESTWDPGFREAVVRLLASEMAMAIAGRPGTSEGLLQSGGAFETIAEGRDN